MEYEYEKSIKLNDSKYSYFFVPASIIKNIDMGKERITVFSFFSIYKGINHSLFFTVSSLIDWLGKKPNRCPNGINGRIIEVTKQLEKNNYLTTFNKLGYSNTVKINFNVPKIMDECKNDNFAIIYVDELEKIINYKNPNVKDSYLNNNTILLIFVYLRMKIYKRRNKLYPEEINIDGKNDKNLDIKKRRLRNPEAYNAYYYDIAKELGLSAKTVSKATAVLNELGLIYSEPLPRTKTDSNWHTNHTLFCNYYKRESKYLLDTGEEYYLREINNKKQKLRFINKMNKNKKNNNKQKDDDIFEEFE